MGRSRSHWVTSTRRGTPRVTLDTSQVGDGEKKHGLLHSAHHFWPTGPGVPGICYIATGPVHTGHSVSVVPLVKKTATHDQSSVFHLHQQLLASTLFGWLAKVLIGNLHQAWAFLSGIFDSKSYPSWSPISPLSSIYTSGLQRSLLFAACPCQTFCVQCVLYCNYLSLIENASPYLTRPVKRIKLCAKIVLDLGVTKNYRCKNLLVHYNHTATPTLKIT